LIEDSNSLLDRHTNRPSHGWFERMHQLWSSEEIVKNIGPIRQLARKVSRSKFIGEGLVEAAARIERAGVPAAHSLSETAREYAALQNCEQLITALAGRVGNAQVGPTPAVWPILALALLEWRNTISANDIVAHAASTGQREQTQRGLLIASFLFPELQGWVAGVQMEVPLWERLFAVPLAARKLVLLEKRHES
jgi:hypothetical protein